MLALVLGSGSGLRDDIRSLVIWGERRMELARMASSDVVTIAEPIHSPPPGLCLGLTFRVRLSLTHQIDTLAAAIRLMLRAYN